MYVNQYTLRYTSERIGRLVKETAHNCGEGERLIDSPEKAAHLLETVFDASNLTQEHFWLIALNGARRVIGVFEVTRGTLMSSLVHPREVFNRAILAGAASIIIAHNHPSEALDVSPQDRDVTERIREAGELLGIGLDDHIICGGGGFASAF